MASKRSVERSAAADERYVDIFAFAPAGAGDIRLGIGLCVLFALIAGATLPWAQDKTPQLDAALPTIGAISLLAEFLGAGLFFSQFVVSRQPPLFYVSIALSVEITSNLLWWFWMPRVYLTAGISPSALQTGPCLLVSGVTGFLIALVMMAGCDIRATARLCRDRRTMIAFSAFTLAAGVISLVIAYAYPGLLPHIVDGVDFTPFFIRIASPLMGFSFVAVLVLILAVKRGRHAIDIWLSVALVAALFEIVTNDAGGARDAFGFYVSRVLGAASASAILLQMGAKMYGVLLALMRANRDLDSQASTDELTGLANRRSFNRAVGSLFAEQRRDDRRAALLMIDLDEFKRYNDGFGHGAGDAALAAVAGTLRLSVARAHDMAARIGGEEFAVILRDTDLAGAVAVAERIRAGVEELAIAHAPGAMHAHITISVGVASTIGHPEIATFDDLAACADAALYAAKTSGRNRVHVTPSVGSQSEP